MINKITTSEQLTSRPDVIEMLNRLAIESEESLDNSLQKRNSRLKSRKTREQTWQVTSDFVDSFERNNTTLLVEEVEGRPVALIGYIENNQEIAERLGVEGDYLMFFKALTEAEYRNTGIFRNLLTEAFKGKESHQVIGCVSIKEAITNEGVEFDHVMNLDMYGSMMSKMFPEPKLQTRYQSPNGRQYGRERFDLKDFIDNRQVKQNKVQEIIDSRKDSEDNKKMIGFYIHSR